jgi:hypothetical protein
VSTKTESVEGIRKYLITAIVKVAGNIDRKSRDMIKSCNTRRLIKILQEEEYTNGYTTAIDSYPMGAD